MLVHAYGEEEAIDALERWLHEGPPLAQVNEVIPGPTELVDKEGFEIG